MRRTLHASLLTLLWMPTLACGSDSVEPDLSRTLRSTVVFVSGNGLADTILATPSQPLVAEYRLEDGTPLRGLALWMEVASGDDHHLRILPLDERYGQVSWDGHTLLFTADSNGQAKARLEFGSQATTATVMVGTQLGVADAALLTIEPGAPVALEAPGKIALLSGEIRGVGATVVDQMGNPRPDPVQVEVWTAPVHLTGPLGLTASDPGHGFMRVWADVGDRRDTALVRVEVYPPGTILGGDGRGSMVANNLLGRSDDTPVVESGHHFSWDPRGPGYAFVQGSRLMLLTANGIASLTPFGMSATDPEFTRDGLHIFFAGQEEENGDWFIFRTRSGSTALERYDQTIGGRHPTPAPDGERIAYVDEDGLKVFDLETTQVRAIAARSPRYPRWSPGGTFIAYVSQDPGSMAELWVVRPDGSDSHRIVTRLGDSGIAWSPDSEWILGGGERDVVRVSDGDRMHTGVNWVTEPSWRPR